MKYLLLALILISPLCEAKVIIDRDNGMICSDGRTEQDLYDMRRQEHIEDREFWSRQSHEFNRHNETILKIEKNYQEVQVIT